MSSIGWYWRQVHLNMAQYVPLLIRGGIEEPSDLPLTHSESEGTEAIGVSRVGIQRAIHLQYQ